MWMHRCWRRPRVVVVRGAFSLSSAMILVACSGSSEWADGVEARYASTAGDDGDAAKDGATSAPGGQQTSTPGQGEGSAGSEGGVALGDGGITNGDCPKAPPTRGLKLRLVANAGVTLSGSGVSTWSDQSGSGNSGASQANAEQRPTVKDNQLNGRPVVHFDGDNDFLSFAFDPNGKDHMTIASASRTWAFQNGGYNPDCDFNKDGTDEVGQELNCSGTDQSLVSWNEGGNAFASHGVFYGVGQREVTFRFGTGKGYRWFKDPFVLQTRLEDKFNWNMAVMDGYDRRFYLNGAIPPAYRNWPDRDGNKNLVMLSTRADEDDGGGKHTDWPSSVQSTETTARIGRGRFEPTSGYWAGDLAELLIYDVALTDQERTSLGAYMRCTYFPN